jgi:hypothetical protein
MLVTRWVLAWAVLITHASVIAADLHPPAAQAYDAYAEEAKRAFLERVRSEAAPARCDGVRGARPGRLDGIIDVPAGLVHHWIGEAFIGAVTLREVIDVSRAYSAYSTMYGAVVASKVLAQQGDRYRLLMRLKGGEGGISAVLDIRSTVEYARPTESRAYAISNADEIREVKNAGERGERLLPAGSDSGYLWRASRLTYFLEQQGGVHVEMETLGLSRRFPTLLRWVIEPYARRLGRRSVERTLHEFVAAVRKSAGRADPGLPCR